MMKLLSFQVPTTYPYSDVFELKLPPYSKLLHLQAVEGVPTIFTAGPDTTEREPIRFTWRFPDDQIGSGWFYVGTTMYTGPLDEGRGESGPLHLFSSRFFDPTSVLVHGVAKGVG